MPSLLETIAFRQPRRAQGEIAAVASELPPATQHYLELLLVSAADSDTSLHYLASLKLQHAGAFRKLALSRPGLQYLVTVFSHSRFLSDEILQNPQWLEQVGDMDRVLLPEEYKARLTDFLEHQPAGTPER